MTSFHGVASPTSFIEIFHVKDDGSLGKSYRLLSRFTSAVLHLDWSNNGLNILGNSQAYENKVFEINDAEKVTKGD